jgi:uncharacterized protein (DUF1778 family)
MIRLSEQIGVRLKKEEKKLLEKVCDARGEQLSNFVRRAVKKELASLSFYSEETKKVLGILKEVEAY